MITIRKAVPEDLNAILELNYELFLHDFPDDTTLNTNWPHQKEGKKYFEDRINEETGVCFVAEDDGGIVGYVTGHIYSEVDPTDTLLRSELDNIYVKDAARGNGVGSMLTSSLQDWAKQKGAQSMFVVAYSGNVDAITFYGARGFTEYALKLEQKL